MKAIVSWIAVIALIIGLPVQSVAAEELKPLETTNMWAANCLAGSRVDRKAPGGFGTSDNMPKKLNAKVTAPEGKVSLVALPAETVAFKQQYRGFRLLLVNRTKSEAEFDAADSRLPIVQEALDAQGKWKQIEFLPATWCGNSYHRVFLKPGYHWEFAAPVYSGSVKTKLRFVLQGKTPVYSNEFEGSIDPGQFVAPPVRGPGGIVSP